MNFTEFHNALRILLNIDGDQFAKAVIEAQANIPATMRDDPERMWPAFRENPWRWMIKAPTPQAKAIWALVEARQPASKVGRTTGQIQSAELLTAAEHALRSYQHGNASPDLAEEVADAIAKARGAQP
jgi:hypothetical protein